MILKDIWQFNISKMIVNMVLIRSVAIKFFYAKNQRISYNANIRTLKNYIKKFITNYRLNRLSEIVKLKVSNSHLICFNNTIAKNIVFHGYYESMTTKLLSERIKTSSYFLDIGANIGYYSILMAELNKKCKILAFEPENKNYQILLKNIKLNSLKNIDAIKKGVSDKEGFSVLHLSSDLYHSINEEKLISKKRIGKEKIPIISLDNFLSPSPKDKLLIKIDVEGHEINVLKGMTNIMKMNNSALVIEYIGSRYSKDETSDFYNLLKSNYNRIFKINEWNNTITPIDEDGLLQTDQKINILCES